MNNNKFPTLVEYMTKITQLVTNNDAIVYIKIKKLNPKYKFQLESIHYINKDGERVPMTKSMKLIVNSLIDKQYYQNINDLARYNIIEYNYGEDKPIKFVEKIPEIIKDEEGKINPINEEL